MVNVRTKTTIRMRVSAHCPSHSKSDIHVRDVDFNIDEPEERGGTNSGPSPTETAVSALIGCTNVIGHKCAAKLGIDIGHLDIEAVCEFDRRGVTLAEAIDTPFVSIELNVRCHGEAEQAQLDNVAAEVDKFCPLSRLFVQAGTRLETTWRPA